MKTVRKTTGIQATDILWVDMMPELIKGHINGYCKSQAFKAAGEFLEGINSHYLTVSSYQRPTAVSGIDPGISLDKIRLKTGNNTPADRIPETGRTSYGIDRIALGKPCGISCRNIRSFISVDF
jgi:hypothetical protein